MDWNKLKTFYEVAINKSISKASIKLNISQSALSRQIQDIEIDLKTALFIRHQKGVILTEQGENLFNTVKDINLSIAGFEKKLLDKKTKPSGKLIINTTVGFGSTWLTPRINEFTKKTAREGGRGETEPRRPFSHTQDMICPAGKTTYKENCKK